MAENNPVAGNRPQAPQKRPQRLNLPFTKRKKDTGTWVYDHRAGLCAMLIVYLVLAILFVGSQVIVRTPKRHADIVVDIRTLEELQKEQARLEREVQMRQQQQAGGDEGGSIRNLLSNENAELRDDRNTNMSALRGSADGLGSGMKSNRDAWDQGMREIEAMKSNRGGDGTGNVNNDTKSKGRVLVSFSLSNPTRYSADLVVPGYRCERGGEVVVQIVVNRSGDVVSTVVDRSLSDNDSCMHSTALDAARRSRFNVDGSAPERQSGTITYMFIPQ